MSKARSSLKTGKNRPLQTAAPTPPDAGALQGLLERPAVHLLLLVLVAIAAYANTFHAPFVFDDDSSIVNNPVVKNLSSFLSGAGYAYNPRRFIGYLTIALNYHLGGLDVTGYHVFNLAVHIINGWLVYFLARLTLRTPFFAVSDSRFLVSDSTTGNQKPETRNVMPLLAALLFVAHPVQTQAVTYIVQRVASLVTMFYLASLVCYIQARFRQQQFLVSSFEFSGSQSEIRNQKSETSNQKPATFFFFFLSLASAILAMRTKEIAITLPLVVLLYEFSFFGAGLRKKLVFLAPLLLTMLILPMGLLNTGKPLGELLSDVNEITRKSLEISRGDYLLTQFSVIVTYIRLIFFPIRQNLDYDYPIYHSLLNPRVFLSFLLLVTLVGLALYLYRRSGQFTVHRSFRPSWAPFTAFQRLIAFGILWFFITLSVESSVIPFPDVIFEHRLYLPSVGAFIALAAGAALAFRSWPPRCVVAPTALLVVVLATATWHRNLVWSDSLALWGDAVGKSPGKSRTNDNYAKALSDNGRMEEALRYVNQSIRIDPRNGCAQYNSGRILDKLGRIDEAITWYQSAINLQPDLKEAYNNLAVDYILKGKLDEAIETYQTVLKMKPDFPEAHNNLGTILKGRNRVDEAINHYRLALSAKPDYVKALNNLGIAYMEQGHADAAIEKLQAAVGLKPDDRDFRENLDKALKMKKARE